VAVSFTELKLKIRMTSVLSHVPIPVAERSNAMVYGGSLAGIADSNTAGGMDVCLL
jgi:hypothetical protein